jgi:hypothetical protein
MKTINNNLIINKMNTKMMSYNEAKVYLKPLGLKNEEEYNAWWNANKPDFLPQLPEEYYGKVPKGETDTLIAMKPVGINTKEKTELIKKVSNLDTRLSNKEKKLFQKVLEKGTKNWSDYDIEFLMLLYDEHYYPILSAFGARFYDWKQEEEIKRETKAKQDNACQRLAEEPYSLWFKDVRHYK